MDIIDSALWKEVIIYLDPVMLYVMKQVNKQLNSLIHITPIYDLPRKCAKFGYLDIIKWLNYPLKKSVSFAAAQYGHLHILEWYGKKLDNNLTYFAAKGGQIEIYDWLKSKGCRDVDIHEKCVKHGRLDFLKHLESNTSDILCIYAVKYGQVETLKWLLDNGSRWVDTGYSIIKKNQVQILDLLYSRGYTVSTSIHNVKSYTLEVIKWRVDHGYVLGKHVIEIAALNGDIPLIKYCLKKGLKLSHELAEKACVYGEFSCVKWLIKHGCPLSDSVLNDAASSGNLDLFKLLIEQGLQISEYTSFSAAEVGSLDILKWMVENNHEIYKDEVFMEAVDNNYPEILEWLDFQYSGDEDPIRNAIAKRSLESFIWLRSHGYKSDVNMLEFAISSRSYDILLLLIDENTVLTVEDICSIVMNSPKKLESIVRKGFKFPDNICDIISCHCNKKTIEILVNQGFKFTGESMERALYGANASVVKWVTKRGFYTPNADQIDQIQSLNV